MAFLYSFYRSLLNILYMLHIFLGVEPWTFEQNLGEAVFIPAGCPHQVRNLKVGRYCNSLDMYQNLLSFFMKFMNHWCGLIHGQRL